MASYAFYAYAGDEATLKMQEGVQMENRLWRELADEFQLPFVDIDGTIPKTDEYFLDWVHFTPKGMRFVAQAFAEQISLQ